MCFFAESCLSRIIKDRCFSDRNHFIVDESISDDIFQVMIGRCIFSSFFEFLLLFIFYSFSFATISERGSFQKMLYFMKHDKQHLISSQLKLIHHHLQIYLHGWFFEVTNICPSKSLKIIVYDNIYIRIFAIRINNWLIFPQIEGLIGWFVDSGHGTSEKMNKDVLPVFFNFFDSVYFFEIIIDLGYGSMVQLFITFVCIAKSNVYSTLCVVYDLSDGK